MALELQQRAIEEDDVELVRLTLIEGGASPALVDSLIPQRPLADGEQYRFHFDMTKCIGCRSCEVACNEQNGNPAEIKWRRVGELEGGTYPDTQRTYLSMGCNHCLSADCLRGCPVDAYRKDPLTGIVLHSAEACIGCQYCVWNCPYSVPQFNPERGVVGKCDMCRDRLLDGREPACVNACPENAIQIEIVNKIAWKADYSQAESPGLPPAGQTLSTTRVSLPETPVLWLERVDTGNIPLEHAHGSLIVMTTLMQAAVGFVACLLLDHNLDPFSTSFLFLVTVLGINVSVLHLGRPAFAWRALKMWRRSWLSREVLCFTFFFAGTAACASFAWLSHMGLVSPAITRAMCIFTLATGTAGTVASACIYLVRARPAWNTIHTPIDFLLSGLMLAFPLEAAAVGLATTASSRLAQHGLKISTPHSTPHIVLFCLFVGVWMVNQIVRAFRFRFSKSFELRATYNHLRGENLLWKFALMCMSGAVAPLFLSIGLPWLSVFSITAAVMLGRYLFFVSVVPLSMGLTFLQGHASQRKVAA